MNSNPFDKPQVIETNPFFTEDRGDGGDIALLTPAEAAFFERESEAEPLILPNGVPLVRRILYWLASIIVNIVFLIILALLFFPAEPEPPSVEAIFSDQIGDQLETMTIDEGNLDPQNALQYALPTPENAPVDELAVFEEKEKEFIDNQEAPFFQQSRLEITQLLTGRTDPGTKNDLIAKYGGTKETREAVRLALAWLAKQQAKNGSWSLKGPYRDGVGDAVTENGSAATGLALLAFQGDGNTRFEGDYSKTVRRGWEWLLTQQGKDGSFFRGGTSSNRFYTQAICVIALSELIAMERPNGKGEELRAVAQKGVDYLIKWQNDSLGGWRYEEGVGSDLSVTGWCLMALQTARVADLFVPKESLALISEFLDRVSYDDGAGYYYSPEEPVRRPSMTATGLLCREYLGWDRKNETLLRGAATLVAPENLIRFDHPEKDGAAKKSAGNKNGASKGNDGEKVDPMRQNVYGWYSTSMMLKHLGPYHPHWRTWNQAMSRELPAVQVPAGRSEAGSWDPSHDLYRFGGGRLYVTALSTLCLEVYYRHLSLYLNP